MPDLSVASSWLAHELWRPAVLTAVAALAGALVGAERERKEKPAGLRTLMLVSVGSAVFTQLSISLTPTGGDRSRIAAQIVTGIGFLGAGAILRGASGIQGVTTAATVWATAAIGMTVGAGHPVAGLALAGFVLLLLVAVAALETRYLGPCRFARAALRFDAADGKCAIQIESILDDYRIPPQARAWETDADGSARVRFTYCDSHKHHREFLTQLAALDRVHAIHREDPAR